MRFFLASIFTLTVGSFAIGSGSQKDSDFVASSVIVRQVMTKQLLGSKQYDEIFRAALERDGGTFINPINNCEIDLGTYSCYLEIEAGDSPLGLYISIRNGEVVSARLK